MPVISCSPHSFPLTFSLLYRGLCFLSLNFIPTFSLHYPSRFSFSFSPFLLRLFSFSPSFTPFSFFSLSLPLLANSPHCLYLHLFFLSMLTSFCYCWVILPLSYQPLCGNFVFNISMILIYLQRVFFLRLNYLLKRGDQ